MRQLMTYLLFGLMTLGISCYNEGPTTGEGAATLMLRVTADTRTDNNEQYNPWDHCTIRIYNNEGLIRRYKSIDELPVKGLQLVSGSYRVVVELGDNAAASWDHKSYRGEETFTLGDGQVVTAEVTCRLTNVVSVVRFEKSIADSFDTDAHAYVCASDEFSSSDIEFDAVPYLKFTHDAEGYFTMPNDPTSGEAKTTLSWCFEGTHKTLGKFRKTGTIEDVKPAHKYRLSFKFSPDLPGFIGFSAVLDTTTDDFDDTIIFSPDPTVKGDGFDETVKYISGKRVYTITSLGILSEVTLTSGGNLYDLLLLASGGSTPLPEISASLIDDYNMEVTLNEAFFTRLRGGDNALEFHVTDADGGKLSTTGTYRMQGLLELAQSDYDLWQNSAQLRAVAFNPASTVLLAYRKANGEWLSLPAAQDSGDIFSATASAVWASATNEAGKSIYTPDPSTGIFAGHTYEYKVIIDGMEYPSGSFTAGGGQSIDGADMEDGSMSCFNNGHGSFWDSGNNSMSDPLCSQSTFAGMQGAKCARLAASKPVLLVNLAAGNLFTGSFNQSGTSGTVAFGKNYNWQARPTAMHVLYYAEKLGTVNQNQHGGPLATGVQDKARIFVAIVDWNSPHSVTSGSSAPSGIWDPASQTSVGEGNIIAYGSAFITEQSSGGQMISMEIPIHYYDRQTKPSKNYTVVISCATSAYGDYMNGCTTNVMYMDDFKWVY